MTPASSYGAEGDAYIPEAQYLSGKAYEVVASWRGCTYAGSKGLKREKRLPT